MTLTAGVSHVPRSLVNDTVIDRHRWSVLAMVMTPRRSIIAEPWPPNSSQDLLSALGDITSAAGQRPQIRASRAGVRGRGGHQRLGGREQPPCRHLVELIHQLMQPVLHPHAGNCAVHRSRSAGRTPQPRRRIARSCWYEVGVPPVGQTALVLLVPEAEPTLGAVASRYPHLVRRGVPAHVTVLYPWLPVDEIDGHALRLCSLLAASVHPVDVSFSALKAHPGMIFLEPDKSEIVDRLIKGTKSCWPSMRPYGGKYPDSPPHLSVALGELSQDEIESLRDLVNPLLPIKSRFDTLHLVSYAENGWTVRERWPFEGTLDAVNPMAEFLRIRRGRIGPADVGLPTGPRGPAHPRIAP